MKRGNVGIRPDGGLSTYLCSQEQMAVVEGVSSVGEFPKESGLSEVPSHFIGKIAEVVICNLFFEIK